MALATGQQPARIVITGAGGIGKTTVALALLHDTRVQERFDRRRHFVSCEGMIDADGVSRRLARVLSLRVDGDLWSAVVEHLKQHETFLVIDNLETIWITDNASVRSATEVMLKTTCEHRQV